MPFTLSHPAAVLPLRRLGLPMTGLVIASMVPDIPVFMGWDRGYAVTHSLLGVVTVDVVVASVAVAFWTFVMRDALVDLAPSPVRSRLPARARPSRRDWALTPVAAVVGAMTHVVWDSFTHMGEWGFDHIAWLRDEHGGLAGFKWAQYASGAIGLAVVAAAVGAHLRSLPLRSEQRHPRLLPAATLSVVVASGAVTAVAAAARNVPSGPYAVAAHSAVDSLIVVGVALVLVTTAWVVRARRTGMPGARSELNDA